MKVTILAIGSQGDLQPYLTLALALKQAGHAVRLAVNANFQPFVASYGVDFHPLRMDSYSFVHSPQGQAWLAAKSPLRLAIQTLRLVSPTLYPILQDAWEACRGAEAIVYHSYAMPTAYYIGQQLGVPCLPVSMYPLPTRAHPALPINPRLRLGGAFNLLSHWVVDYFTWQVYRPSAQRLWQTRIPRTSPYRLLYAAQRPIVCCYSHVVLPKPGDVPAGVTVTGYWFLPPAPQWQPSPALESFLQSGTPPVYVGFGSMGNPVQARQTTEIVLDALARTERRGVLAAGWSGLGLDVSLPSNIFVLDSAPHTWLLPQMTAVVHHGGVGTTGAGLQAGVPNVVVPHFGDQYFWGHRIATLGAGPAPINRAQLTTERLAQAIDQAVHNQALRQRAADIGSQMRAERGVAQGVELFQQFIEG